MSDNAHDVQKDLNKYRNIFLALIAGTIITVLVNEINFSTVALTVAVALFIACIKSFLVAGYFMHLMSERKMIYCVLAFTVVFFIGLMALTIWSMNPDSIIHNNNP